MALGISPKLGQRFLDILLCFWRIWQQKVWDATGFFSLSECVSPFCDTCTAGASVGAITVWTATADESVLIGVHSYCRENLNCWIDSYTLAVTAQGVTCGSGGSGGCTSSDDGGDCTSSETSDDSSDWEDDRWNVDPKYLHRRMA